MRKRITLAFLLACCGAATLAAAILLTPVTTGLDSPFGIALHAPSGSLIVSVNYPDGVPNNLETIEPGGSHAPYALAAVQNLDGAILLGAERTPDGVFPLGEVFMGNNERGEVARVSADGSVFTNPWVTLPGEKGKVRGLHVDTTGVFGGQLIVGMTSGNVWRIDGSGTPALLGSTGLPIEGLTTVPYDVDRYGPWAGKVVLATGLPYCGLAAISGDGAVAFYNLAVCARDVDIINPDGDLYVTIAGRVTIPLSGNVLTAPASTFAAMGCDLLVTESKGRLWHVRWDGTAFQQTAISKTGNYKHATFSGTDERCQPVEICGDGIDNDGDGQIDEGCVEICGDGIDNDGDGQIDEGCVEICGDGIDNDGDGQIDEGCVDAGCTPGYWKNHPASWVTYAPSQTVGSVFALPPDLSALSGDTLMQALQYQGGTETIDAARILLRAAVAALLNSTNAGVGYPLSTAQILAHVNAALAGGNRDAMLGLKNVLDAYNNLNCPL